jgi:SAM-dependent methyltransferase
MILQSLRTLALDMYHLVIPPRIDREIRRARSLPQERFPESLAIPDHYGLGMNERVLEILIARLSYKPGRKILDVGHANVLNAHLRMLAELPKPLDITGIDITQPHEQVRPHYKTSVTGNIIKTDFPSSTFDVIWCISALEHFGMDNSVYTNQFTIDSEMDLQALKEMMRIVRNGGMIFISVPFGKFENHGWLKNYDLEHWQKLMAVASPSATIHNLYFKYSGTDGWKNAAPEELATTGYLDHDNSGASGLAVALIVKR